MKPKKPDLKCPECSYQAWATAGPTKKGKMRIRCAMGHQNTIDTPDGWKPDKAKFRRRPRGFY